MVLSMKPLSFPSPSLYATEELHRLACCEIFRNAWNVGERLAFRGLASRFRREILEILPNGWLLDDGKGDEVFYSFRDATITIGSLIYG